MARYIDADKFKSHLEKAMEKMHIIAGVKAVDVGAVIKALDMQPTADVVPKSEVEKLQNELVIWKQNRFNLFQRLECYEMARQKVASEIFAEIEFDIHQLMFERDETRAIAIEGIIAELKKKYTE